MVTFVFFDVVESIQKFRLLKKSAHLVLMTSLEKAIWNWMDTYPNEFADLQVRSAMITLAKLLCDRIQNTNSIFH